ncbi:hypothetical protein [Devosia ginsengisoli]|uniref:Transmembrane protein n=1 Tax=Devosia ginsengisoli TaxID=400770 RepID=A0A5B8LWQ4_9HYPH|nr:hypothetical protein [Devosia ginsengisoli]QDZ12005.1 hypothetical protein FPZ08_15395 [Devosia ginsengisoli]
MPGASLSRWTLTYFACALLCLVGAEALMVMGFGFPGATIEAPETLILVHLVAIGWLSLLMCGALFQFVPVLVARPLLGDELPPVALAFILTGLVILLSGFAGMTGLVAVPAEAMPLGGLLLLLGFGTAILSLGRTLWAARPLTMPARFVVVGLAALAGTALFGESFALILSGLVGGEAALSLLLNGVPLHALLGLGGWLTFTAMGVSYRLLAMFMLAPETERFSTSVVLATGTLTLMLIAAATPFALAAESGLAGMLLAAAVTGLCALGVYGSDMLALYRQRKRRNIELNAVAAIGAFAALLAACLLLVFLLFSGSLPEHVGALTYLFAFGWLGGLGLAKLYKIVAFLTWLECFAPVLGKRQTPRVQDLVDERHAAPWFGVYYLAVGLGTLTLLVELPLVFRIVAGVQLFATLAIIRHLYRARELLNVPPDLRRGFARPHPFWPQPIARKLP